VNKVETKVEARFEIKSADFLPSWVKENLLKKHKNRINRAGILCVSAQEQRTQMDNTRIAMQKLQEMIDEASYIPKPPSKEKQAKLRAIHRRSNAKRLEDKRRKSQRKQFKNFGKDW